MIARDLGVGRDALAARTKLMASLSPASNDLAQRFSQRFHVDPIPWYGRAEDLAALPDIAAAVWRERRIEFSYESWSGRVQRRVDPLGLVQKGGLWYLIAAVGAQPRTYRVATIIALTVLDAPARRPKRFDLPRYWTSWSAHFEARLVNGEAQVRISEEGRRILRAVAPAAAAVVDATAQDAAPNGWALATLPYEEAQAPRQILRLGERSKCLRP